MPTATKTKAKKSAKKAKKTKLDGKAKTIHMAVLLDESGSMGGNREAVIEGTNEFVNSLRGEKNSKKARITLATFDDSANRPLCRILRDAVKLDDFGSRHRGRLLAGGDDAALRRDGADRQLARGRNGQERQGADDRLHRRP